MKQMLFGLGETALILGVSRRTVARLVKRAELQSLLIGRRRLVPHAAIKKFVQGRCK